MRKPPPFNFSGWTVQQLVAYGAECADALDTCTHPASRKQFHATNVAILKELGKRLDQRTSPIYVPKYSA